MGARRATRKFIAAPNTPVSFLPKIKIEVAVATDQVDKTIDTITTAAKTGQIGDGKIFVLTLDTAVRIRTGETDTAAL
jgi:nitrogen regulatory protein P-II 2